MYVVISRRRLAFWNVLFVFHLILFCVDYLYFSLDCTRRHIVPHRGSFWYDRRTSVHVEWIIGFVTCFEYGPISERDCLCIRQVFHHGDISNNTNVWTNITRICSIPSTWMDEPSEFPCHTSCCRFRIHWYDDHVISILCCCRSVHTDLAVRLFLFLLHLQSMWYIWCIVIRGKVHCQYVKVKRKSHPFVWNCPKD